MRAAVACGILGWGALVGCSGASLQGTDARPGPDGRTDADAGPVDVTPSTDLPAPTDLTSATDLTSPPDAGFDAAEDGPGPLTDRRSFVVTSMFIQRPDAGSSGGPTGSGHRFTMVLDWAGRTAICGANGSGGIAPFLATGSGGAINQTMTFALGNGSSVIYQGIDFAVDAAGTLSGTGQGYTVYLPPNTDVGSTTSVTMLLTGVPDAEPPTFTADVGSVPIDPFASLTVTASEPLPPDSRLALVDVQGERFDLPPVGTSAVAAFSFAPSPFRMWRYNNQYSVLVGGIVDFAGNSSSQIGAIVFSTAAPPPRAAEDGFEGVTGTTFGNAQVLSGTGAPTISGAVSLYIPALPSTITPGRGAMTQLALRLPLNPTDTVVRFSYRSVNPSTVGGTPPGFLLGSEGGQVTYTTLPSDSGQPTTAMIGQSQVMLGPLMTAQLALPSDAAASGEITLLRKVPTSGSNLPAPPVTGLIIDDLRAE